MKMVLGILRARRLSEQALLTADRGYVLYLQGRGRDGTQDAARARIDERDELIQELDAAINQLEDAGA